MMFRGWILGGTAALAALAQTGWGQPASPWRAYKVADGLAQPACSTVTIGPKGTVVSRHLLAPSVSKLDGYSVNVLPAPPIRTGRIYDSPAGQLWAVGTNGLFEFSSGQWVFRPLPEIVAESAVSATSLPPNVVLYPVRQGRLLILLRDRLMELSAAGNEPAKMTVLRSTSQSRIGPFLGMTVARDGGLWISGARGLAKVPPPMRNLNADTPWQEFEVPKELKNENLREPREDEAGGVTSVAESIDDRSPVVMQFDGQRWNSYATGAERVRFAWGGPEQTQWAVTSSTLLLRRDNQNGWTPDETCPAHKFFDMAIEPGGAFWLATLDGLFRYAPPVWRTPVMAETLAGSLHGMTDDAEGGLWFVTGGELHSLRYGEHRTFSFPDALRNALQTANTLVTLSNVVVLVGGDERLYQFHPDREEFAAVALPKNDATVKFLGVLKEGIACLVCSKPGDPEPRCRLEKYDGKDFKPLAVPSPMPIREQNLVALFQTQSGDLWLTAEQGLARLRDGKWETFLATEKSAPQTAQLFLETSDKRLWCAADDDLWFFDGDSWVVVRVGFDHINSLGRSRNDVLWVASNSGLHRLTSSGWIENGLEEGLPSTVIRTLCTDRRGQLWAGTSRGLSVYHPEADLDPPRTEIYTRLDQPISERGSLTIGFGGQDKWKFTPRNRLLYSHRLDDGDWSLFQERYTVTLADLPAGAHTFQVRAVDRNGNIERKPARLEFAVTLPWFKETRLVLLGTFASVAVVFFATLAFNRHRQLRRSYAEIEKKVAERTHELEVASRELLHSQKMNALGTLAAGIAHDFNNILSIIKGSAQIIEDNLDNPAKIRTRLDRIKIVVEQGAGTVQAMLGFSRSSDGSKELCNVNQIVRNTITLLGDRFLREVEVRVEGDPSLPEVLTARDLVQQILLNLILNAAESMNADKRVVLRTARLNRLPKELVLKPAEAAEYIVVSVQDFGAGIQPEHLSRVFEPFFTTKAMSARRGTGLGLSMVYELAKQLNAGLAMESFVGRGSTFTLILPLSGTAPAPENKFFNSARS